MSIGTLAATPDVRVSLVADNGMPRNIVPRGADWNFGAGSLWTHKGWQYAAYWDKDRQVSVARRQLPTGPWSVVSLPDYQRMDSGDRGKGGRISRGFGDGHEKVAMGISPDGVIHLSFDHHLSTLRYRTTRRPVADDPASHPWSAALFGPVRDHLGGPPITSATYPVFHTDGEVFLLSMRLGGGSGSANSHLFTYRDGDWLVNSERDSQIIDKAWSGGDRTVNAYPFGLVIRDGRCHLTWCWRDTPNARTCHDFCYAYSDDFGDTWRNGTGEVIGKRGEIFITADSPGVAGWKIPPGTRYRNGGSMTVDAHGGVHALVRDERGRGVHMGFDPKTKKWQRQRTRSLGKYLAFDHETPIVFAGGAVYAADGRSPSEWRQLHTAPQSYFENCKAGGDRHRFAHDGWVSVIGQQGQQVRVIDFPINPKPSSGP